MEKTYSWKKHSFFQVKWSELLTRRNETYIVGSACVESAKYDASEAFL
jgi:hypothetical protein